MATELEELLGFLSSPSPQLRKAAVDIVRGLTGSEDGLLSLSHYSEIVLPSLSRLLGEKKDISEPAIEALINLSQQSELSEKMIAIGMIRTAMEMLYKQDSAITRLLVMLLVNLTQLDAGIVSMLQIGDEKMQGLYVMKLVRSFCTSSSETSGSILVNVSKMEAGRKVLLDPKRGLLKQIIRQFDSATPLRKKGISGTIRNCCFEADSELQNLLLISEFLWPALLLPVAGKKVYSEQDISKMPLELGSALSIEREPVNDPEIRVQTLEAIYLISLQEAGRRALWSVNGPRILQVGYEDEEDPNVMEAYEQIGSLSSSKLIVKAIVSTIIPPAKAFDDHFNWSMENKRNVPGKANNMVVEGCIRRIFNQTIKVLEQCESCAALIEKMSHLENKDRGAQHHICGIFDCYS
ncbi:hypothetical protein HHK36_024741 [Tetracentron sinense]|uniref:Protein HGH1 homolog n=1 Tax=Tetracentron sinense TaxID=13715 RepID=A0A834YPL1_TETSI|nr:hypothetical protein HHK36_024741 [Tetracentron sinense]